MDPIKDPAWFYSTLSQTAAAIVGLIGAVLGSQIIAHISRQRDKKKELDGMIFNTKTYFTTRTKNLSDMWTNKAVTSSGGQPPPDQQMLMQVVQTYESISVAGKVDSSAIKFSAEALRRGALAITSEYPTLHEIQTQMNSDATRLEDLHPRVDDFQKQRLPRSFVFLFVVLIVLIIVGIMWPLIKIPAQAAATISDAVPMLITFSFGMLLLLIYFAWQGVELLRIAELSWDVKP
jgi:hypothetical protein